MTRKPKPISHRRFIWLAGTHLLFFLLRPLDRLMFRHGGRRKPTLPPRALAVRPPAEVLAAATHTAQPAVARQRLGKGDLPVMTPHRLRVRLEVGAEAIRRRRSQPLKIRMMTAWTRNTSAEVHGTS